MAGEGFCPKCGAVMYNNVCASCGYGRSGQQAKESGQVVDADVVSENGGRFSSAGDFDVLGDSQYGTASRKGPGIGIVIVAGICICVIAVLIFLEVMFSQVMDTVVEFSGTIEAIPESVVPYDYYEDSFDEYIPDPSDDYLESIVSSTVRGLSYDIAWNDTCLYADDANNAAVFYCYYPFIIGSDAEYVDDINAAISREALSFMPDTLGKDDYGYLDGYVTYMSEEMLSVVFIYYYECTGTEVYHISALNFDMNTGEQITLEEMLPTFDFVADFRRDCVVQNGEDFAGVLEEMTDDEIMKAITTPGTGVVFQSPVGLDIGFNYPDGWMTATLKFAMY